MGDNLMEKTTRHFVYVPRLLPYTEKQILQNIIWLIACNHVKSGAIKFSVFGNSLSAKVCLNYLNFKSIVLGKMFGIGSSPWIAYIINGVKYILKGDLNTLSLKIKECKIILFNKIFTKAYLLKSFVIWILMFSNPFNLPG